MFRHPLIDGGILKAWTGANPGMRRKLGWTEARRNGQFTMAINGLTNRRQWTAD
jgi:hypothetical protein